LRAQLRRLSAAITREGGHPRVPSAMALSTAEMRVLPAAAHPPLPRGDRRRAAHLPHHRQDPGRRGLPETAQLHPHRGRAPQPRTRPAHLITADTQRARPATYSRQEGFD
jgi:hypothetical protein